MRKLETYVWPVFFIVMAVGLGGCSVSQVKDLGQEAETTSADFEQVVELPSAVHFLNPAGENVIVPPGIFSMIASDGMLKLIPDSRGDAQAVTIQAEATSHQELLDLPTPLSARMDEDLHVVAMFLPDGRAMEAIGTYSGVRTRAFNLRRGFLKGLKVPRMNGILTTPNFGTLHVNGTLIIKGKNFGSLKEGSGIGKVLLHGRFKHNVPNAVLPIEEWSPTRIKAKVESDVLLKGVMDQQVRIQIKTAKGLTSPHWKMPLRATRSTRWLSFQDKAVKLLGCSEKANANTCNGYLSPKKGICAVTRVPVWEKKEATIWAMHNNCTMVVDWDEGSDRYDITLKNGWVFKKFWRKKEKSGAKEWVNMPSYNTLNDTVVGTSTWKPTIKWKISPSDWIRYMYWVQIEGPRGVPYR